MGLSFAHSFVPDANTNREIRFDFTSQVEVKALIISCSRSYGIFQVHDLGVTFLDLSQMGQKGGAALRKRKIHIFCIQLMNLSPLT